MSVAAALVLALVVTLVGPMGTQTARADDGNPMFRVGTHKGTDYVNFINDLRRRVNDGGNSKVPGAGDSYQVQHTNTSLNPGPSFPTNRNRHDAYVQVDIQMWGNPNFVRLQLRRSDLYVLGWWDRNNIYHFMGNRNVPQEERERMQNGTMRNASDTRRTAFQEGYVSIQTEANELRSYLPISRDSISSAAWYLYDSNDNQNMARGVLRLAQFISEAARFRPLRDNIALVMGNGQTYRIPPEFAAQQNDWARLSGRFNWLLGMGQGYRDRQPITTYQRGAWGQAVTIVLYTAVQYAQYVLGTAKGRN